MVFQAWRPLQRCGFHSSNNATLFGCPTDGQYSQAFPKICHFDEEADWPETLSDGTKYTLGNVFKAGKVRPSVIPSNVQNLMSNSRAALHQSLTAQRLSKPRSKRSSTRNLRQAPTVIQIETLYSTTLGSEQSALRLRLYMRAQKIFILFPPLAWCQFTTYASHGPTRISCRNMILGTSCMESSI